MNDPRSNLASPQNPYKSFIVSASAGSGKTYQLAHRFLNLVIAGTDPKYICTITFTKLATKEMSYRIRKLAHSLFTSNSLKDKLIQDFYSFNPKLSLSYSDIDSGCKKILSLDQNLRISTIDSLFYDWIKMFPYESGLFDKDFYFDILDSSGKTKEFYQKAWCYTLKDLYSISSKEFEKKYPLSSYFIKQEGISFLKTRVMDLMNHELFVLRNFTQNNNKDSEGPEDSKNTLKTFGFYQYFNQQDSLAMSQLGIELFDIFSCFYSHLSYLKQKYKLLDFSDITKGVYNIFTNEEFLSSRFLIHSQIHHLLIDEFQDTNRIWWNIFKSISEELLMDKSGLVPKTVFFVADKKQSIYSFREADPSIMEEASNHFKDYGVNEISLNYNFRTSRTLTTYINEVFSKLLDGFKNHIPATDMNNNDLVEDYSSFSILDPLIDKLSSQKDLREQEAYLIGTYIKKAILVLKKGSKSTKNNNGSDTPSNPLPLEYKDITVLYRQSTGLEVYFEVFKKLGIPFKYDSQDDFLSYREISDIMALIKSIAFNDEVSFLQLLGSPIISMSHEDICRWLEESKEKKKEKEKNKLNQDIYVSDDLKNKYQDLNIILNWRKNFSERSAYEVVSSLFYELSILEKYKRLNSKNFTSIWLNLLKLLDTIYSLEQEGIRSLVGIISNLEGPASSQIKPYSDDSNAVSFQSIHKSKGLEYPLVILIDTISSWSKPVQYWTRFTDSSYQTKLGYVGLVKDRQKIKDSDFNDFLKKSTDYLEKENLRLLYVALTRACNHLLISGYSKKTDYKNSFFNSLFEIIQTSFNPQKTYLSYKIENKKDSEKKNHPVHSVFSSMQKPFVQSDILTKDETDLKESLTNKDIHIDSIGFLDTKDPSYFKDLIGDSKSRVHEINQLSVHSIMSSSKFKLLKDDKPGYEDNNLDSDLDLDLDSNLNQESKSSLEYGTLVHRYLEYYIKHNELPSKQNYNFNLNHNPNHDQSLLDKAFLEFKNTVESSMFLNLTKNSELYPEYRICSLSQSRLIRGVIDLLVIKKDLSCIYIIDYKTGSLNSRYILQLAEYQKIIEKLYPGVRVKAFILKTSTQELIDIHSIQPE